MVVMITGGTGFIGTHLARRILHAGERVVLFDAQPDLQAIQEQHIFNIGGDFRAHRALGMYLKTLVPEAQIEITNEVAESGYRSARHINSRIAEALEFRPQWPLERGVRATVNWARQRAGLTPVT